AAGAEGRREEARRVTVAGAGRGPTIAVLDYGMGNLQSVEKALERVGARAEVTSDHGRVRAADGAVLPGVGAFPAAMRSIRERGLDGLLGDRVAAGVPVLGLCLGMQLLFEWSEEHGGDRGLGLLEGTVEPLGVNGLKVPQIGWNPVSWRRGSRLVDGLPDPCAFYHVHSFAPVPADPGDVLGTATYGQEFVSAVEREPVYGVQFHPEKSGEHGLRLLAAFAAACGA
ncbi:MAG TPA: imidazole glycerol phosphate synthase subunit HisH, partial [Thermoleophilaceae bacterium]|nr:imidazole glycerol phosphate synthase subunit HisH [Thermoleophilaceae bacterium]